MCVCVCVREREREREKEREKERETSHFARRLALVGAGSGFVLGVGAALARTV